MTAEHVATYHRRVTQDVLGTLSGLDLVDCHVHIGSGWITSGAAAGTSEPAAAGVDGALFLPGSHHAWTPAAVTAANDTVRAAARARSSRRAARAEAWFRSRCPGTQSPSTEDSL